MENSIRVNFPPVSLKIVVAVHFVLTIWGDQIKWLPVTYLFCNLLVLAIGVWAIASPTNEDASQLWSSGFEFNQQLILTIHSFVLLPLAVATFLLGMLFTVLHDIIVFSIQYDSDHPRFASASHYRFCVGMAILSLILKPLSCLLIFQNHRSRGGEQGYSYTGTPYVTIEGHTSPQPQQGYTPVPAPGQPSSS